VTSPMTDATEIPEGYAFEVEYPMFAARIAFVSRSQLNLNVIEGGYAGYTETVDYQVINLRPGLFVVSWQEQRGTVVQVDDFANRKVYGHITLADDAGAFVRMAGAIREVAA
jgi:MoaF-like